MKAQYFVLNENGQWKIKAGYRLTGPYHSKTEAMCVAPGLVQREDRTYRVEWTYGRDPYPSMTARPWSPAVSPTAG